MDDTVELIGDEALNRCLDLRSALSKSKANFDVSTTASVSQSISHDFTCFPKTILPSAITPWKSSTIPTTHPPLPKVLDPTLEASSFVHQGMGRGAPTDLSYERLEWVGDAYIELIATLLISQTFPALGPGKASQLREQLVKNVTLSGFSYHYGFDTRARLPVSIESASREDKTKIMGDIFEAYVAAIILSDPVDGLRQASEWLKDLWGMTIAKDIIYEERKGMNIDSPLWRLRGTAEPIQDVISKTLPTPMNPKDALQKFIGSKVAKLTYKDAAPERKDPHNKLPLFTVGVYLDGWGERQKLLGSGKANGKKDAGFRAAQMALDNKKLMKIYSDKKTAYDTQMALEKEALESQINA